LSEMAPDDRRLSWQFYRIYNHGTSQKMKNNRILPDTRRSLKPSTKRSLYITAVLRKARTESDI
jgi:hypothetical protein